MTFLTSTYVSNESKLCYKNIVLQKIMLQKYFLTFI